MPARLPLTPEQALERIREQGRRRASRYRERRHATGNVTPPREAAAGNVTPSPPIPPSSPSISLEIEKIGAILAPFAARGYEHKPEFWAEMAAAFPAVRLVVEAYNIASWLREPRAKNQKARCTEKFVINWLKGSGRDRPAVEAPPPQRPAPGKPPDPEPVLPPGVSMERIDPAVARRALAEARRLTLPEKLALAKNGRH
jgi:hypothetical protein